MRADFRKLFTKEAFVDVTRLVTDKFSLKLLASVKN